jgi:hypothetical protein
MSMHATSKSAALEIAVDAVVKPEGRSIQDKIISIIGIHPNQAELIVICKAFGWGPLTRAEKRVKSELLKRLESMRETIMPFLESPAGASALSQHYIDVLKQQKAKKATTSVPVASVPPEGSLRFYFNHPPSSE